MRWNVVSLVARREIIERAQTRAFVISTVVLLVVVAGLTALSSASGGVTTTTVGAAGPGAADLARSGIARAESAGVRLEIKPYPSVAAARKAIADDELGSALVTPAGGPRLLVGKEAERTAVTVLQSVLGEREARALLEREGVAPGVVQRALGANGPPLDEITPPRDATSRGIAYLGALLLYLAILTYGFFIAMGIVTEKATRVVEVILSAVRPVELLTGKVVGLGLLSLVQFSLVAVVAFGAALATGVDLPAGAPLAILLVVVFSLLGYLLYACAFVVTGSVVSRQEDLQGSSAPLTVMLVAGFILTQTALNAPHGTFATVLSIFPLTAPLAMPSRVALTDVPAWEIALAAALTLVTALLVLRGAAGIYAATVLRTGLRVPLREALRLRRG
jgi:ABC-2 type transport system permease protein